MKRSKTNKISITFCLIILSICVNFAFATVVGFEDLYSGLSKSSTNLMPANYAGYSWSSTFRLMTEEYATTSTSGVGYSKGMFGNVVGYTSGPAGSNRVEISSAVPFDFAGAYITSVWKMNQDVQIQGYDNGQIKYNTMITTSCDHAYWFNFDFKDIDRLCITPGVSGTDYYSNYRGNHLAIDNMTFVPEPATLILVGFGVIGMRLGKRSRS